MAQAFRTGSRDLGVSEAIKATMPELEDSLCFLHGLQDVLRRTGSGGGGAGGAGGWTSGSISSCSHSVMTYSSTKPG